MATAMPAQPSTLNVMGVSRLGVSRLGVSSLCFEPEFQRGFLGRLRRREAIAGHHLIASKKIVNRLAPHVMRSKNRDRPAFAVRHNAVVAAFFDSEHAGVFCVVAFSDGNRFPLFLKML